MAMSLQHFAGSGGQKWMFRWRSLRGVYGDSGTRIGHRIVYNFDHPYSRPKYRFTEGFRIKILRNAPWWSKRTRCAMAKLKGSEIEEKLGCKGDIPAKLPNMSYSRKVIAFERPSRL